MPDKEGSFTQKIRRLPNVKDAKKRIDGKAERIWLGLSVKGEADEVGLLSYQKSQENIIGDKKGASDASGASLESEKAVSGTEQLKVVEETSGLKRLEAVQSHKEINCRHFRRQSCQSNNWQFINGNDSAVGKKCFEPIEASKQHDGHEDYPEPGEGFD